jgi:hypothetical protein
VITFSVSSALLAVNVYVSLMLILHHSSSRFLNNWAFMATITVLNDINKAPTAGESTKPRGYKTPAARGRAKTFYPAAQNKFWIIFLWLA